LQAQEDIDAARAYVRAMSANDPAARDAARMALLSSPRDNSSRLAAATQLAALGYVDDAYRISLGVQYPPTENINTSWLFFPPADALRRDPRFKQLADKLGLLDYWRRSGTRPDFCDAPGFPYNCDRLLQQ
jgi:hypothetical protein